MFFNRLTDITFRTDPVYIHIFWTSVLVGGGQLHAPAALPRTNWIGGWVGTRTGLDDVEKRKFLPPPGLELRPLGHPAHSQSLYRLLI
jgi:hypothetical protein